MEEFNLASITQITKLRIPPNFPAIRYSLNFSIHIVCMSFSGKTADFAVYTLINSLQYYSVASVQWGQKGRSSFFVGCLHFTTSFPVTSPFTGFLTNSQLGVLDSVAATARAEDIWRSQTSNTQYVTWRYIATGNGVLKIYPGVYIRTRTLNAVQRPWYASHMSDPVDTNVAVK